MMLIKRKEKPFDPLEKTILRLSDNVSITLRDVLASIGIFGRTGSAKTTGSGASILRGLVGAVKSGGLILGAKPEDRAAVVKVFRDAGRENDLYIFEPGGNLRFNIIDSEMQHGGQTRNIVSCLTTIGESLRGRESKGGGEDGSFWEKQAERLLYNAVEIVKQARGHVSAPAIQEFISTAPYSPEQIGTPEWQEQFNNQCLKQAFGREKTVIEQNDFDLAKQYWLSEFPQMADKTRASILATVMSILHVFNTGLVRLLLSTTTNVSPEEMLKGKWVFVNMPPCEYHDVGTFVSCALKYATQRCILRRAATASDIPVFIWCDEAQGFVNSFDSHYLAQSRSHMGGTVYLTQSLHSYYAAMPGQAGKHQADALLSNFGHKIFHALGDTETAEYASGLIGKSLQTFVGGSMSPTGNVYDEFIGETPITTSTSEHFEYTLQPHRFMNGLRTGGTVNGMIADAIIVRSGRPFSNGQNWMQVAFRQT